jgi:opacity protein-like surface antigen
MRQNIKTALSSCARVRGVVRTVKRYLVASLLSLFMSAVLHAQVVAAGRGGAHVVAGGLFSAYSPDYGPNELFGIGGFVDLNLRGHLGVEGEMRFLRFNQTYDVHEDNYELGPRYRWRFGRWEPYGKFMIGNGQFNFPFNYGHGGYLMLVPGAGLDIHYHRFTIRAVDYEYQHWTNFQNSSLSPDGLSSGIAYRIF